MMCSYCAGRSLSLLRTYTDKRTSETHPDRKDLLEALRQIEEFTTKMVRQLGGCRLAD